MHHESFENKSSADHSNRDYGLMRNFEIVRKPAKEWDRWGERPETAATKQYEIRRTS